MAALERRRADPFFVEKVVEKGIKFDDYFYYRPRVFREAVTKEALSTGIPRFPGWIENAISERRVAPGSLKTVQWMKRNRVKAKKEKTKCDKISPKELCSCSKDVTSIVIDTGYPFFLNRIPGCMEKFKKLTNFEVFYASIHKIENLENLKALKSVDFNSNEIHRIEGMDGLEEMESLNMNHNAISKIEGTGGMTKLKVLNLAANKIDRIEGLESNKDLKSLDLSVNNIRKIENLDGLGKLESLNLNNNKISKIEGIESLSNLSNLSLNSNAIKKIEGLDNLGILSQLWLGYNSISKIEGLEKSSGITYLRINGNKISKIEGLDNLLDLKDLSLSKNGISTIEGLSANAKLTDIELQKNQISIKIFESISKERQKAVEDFIRGQGKPTEEETEAMVEIGFDLLSKGIDPLQGLNSLGNLDTLILRENDISGENCSLLRVMEILKRSNPGSPSNVEIRCL